MTTITIPNDFEGRTINSQTVYTKTAWVDDWDEQEAVVCTQAKWTASPSIPTATFYYRYGVASVNGTAFADWSKYELPTYGYVKVEFETVDLTLADTDPGYETTVVWIGLVVSKDDFPAGDDVEYNSVKTPSGKQIFYAVGFEYLLNQCYIRTGRGFEEGQADGEDLYCAPTFNFRNAPNRTETGVTDSNEASQASQVFHIPKRSGGGTSDPDYWSTKDIVQYLLCWNTPKSSLDALDIPFVLYDQHDILPDWDRPVFSPEKQRLLVVLNSLMSRQRGLAFKFEVDEDEAGDTVVLIPFSLRETTASNGSLGNTWAANANLIDVDLRYTPGVTLLEDGHSKFDKVTVIGGRVIYVWTTGQTDSYSTFADGWSSTQENIYSTGVSGHADYSGWSEDNQKILDSLTLAGPEVKDVFTRYRLDETDPPEEKNFPPIDDLTSVSTSDSVDMRYWFERPILSWVPFNVGTDYTSGSSTYDWDQPTESIIPFATTTVDASGDDITTVFDMRHGGLSASISSENDLNVGFTCNVVANSNPREFELYINGTLPHKVGPGGSDITREFGDAPGIEVEKITMAMEGDRFTEVSESTGNNVDAVREKLIDVGDRYRVIVAVKDTAFSLLQSTTTATDPASLKTITAAKLIRDDRPYMEAIASAAIAWYGVDRRALSWSMKVPTSSLFVGQLIENVQLDDSTSEAVNTVITSVTVTAGIAQLGQSPMTSWKFETQFSEIDVA